MISDCYSCSMNRINGVTTFLFGQFVFHLKHAIFHPDPLAESITMPRVVLQISQLQLRRGSHVKSF